MQVPARLLPLTVQPLPNNGEPRRGRGRPPGAKNKVKRPDGGVNTPQQFGTGVKPPPRKVVEPNTNEDIDQEKNKQAEKEGRADHYAGLIHKELNDQLFTTLIGMRLVPAGAIYTAGNIPPASVPDPRLTELGNMIAIPSDVAKSWGKLLAELSYTNAGKSVVGLTQNNNTAVFFAALAALYSTFRYTQQLKPFLDMLKAAQEAQRLASQKLQEENNDDNGGV
jgi:hypothetical protein